MDDTDFLLDRKPGFPPRSKSTPLERFPSIGRAESSERLSDCDDGTAVEPVATRRKQGDKSKNTNRNPYLSSLGKCRSENHVSDYDRKLFTNALPWIPMTKTWQMRMHNKEEKQMDRRVSSLVCSAWRFPLRNNQRRALPLWIEGWHCQAAGGLPEGARPNPGRDRLHRADRQGAPPRCCGALCPTAGQRPPPTRRRGWRRPHKGRRRRKRRERRWPRRIRRTPVRTPGRPSRRPGGAPGRSVSPRQRAPTAGAGAGGRAGARQVARGARSTALRGRLPTPHPARARLPSARFRMHRPLHPSLF